MIKKTFILLTFVVSLFLFSANTFAEDNNTESTKAINETTISIFTSDECEFCTELEEEIQEKYLSIQHKFKNIDESKENKQEFDIAIVTCAREEGSVPLVLHEGTCITGKEKIIEIFEGIRSAEEISNSAEADDVKVDLLTSGLNLLEDSNITDTLHWYDYVIALILFILLVVGLALTIRFSKSQNKRLKLISASILFISIAGFVALLYIKVNSLNNLATTGAEAGKSVNNCLTTNTCKDWNEYVKSKAEYAESRGDRESKKEWESKVIDQKIIDQQITNQNNALLEALKKDPTLCGAGAQTCSYGKFLTNISNEANTIYNVKEACSSESTLEECKSAKTKAAEKYKELLYGTDKSNGIKGGLYRDAIDVYNNKLYEETYNSFVTQVSSVIGVATSKQIEELCAAIANSGVQGQCNKDTLVSLLKENRSRVSQYILERKTVDNYTGLQVITISSNLYDLQKKISDECLVPTSGGACPIGTATCECQTTPTYRATCAAIGQNCNDVCIATHNVCVNCSKEPIKEENIPKPPPPGQAICRQQCSSTVSCSDGTSCINGLCVNASCPNDFDCMCNTSTPICGDGIINDSPQAPEQCELGNPPGALCDWNSCNQNTCTCPNTPPLSTNPNWEIEKNSSVICVDSDPNNVYAKVNYNISVTYINEDKPDEQGILERIVDRPQNYLSQWLEPSSINNGGTHTSIGGMVEEIRWDLTPPLSTFTIPNGQTEVSKNNMLSYTFNVPKAYFGGYINIVTGYPNQDSDAGEFSNNHSVYIGCSIPTTAIPSEAVAKILVGIFLLSFGIVFSFSSNKGEFAIAILGKKFNKKLELLFAPKNDKEYLSRSHFEEKIMEKSKKE